VSYLEPRTLINLALSKMFTPALFTIPLFFRHVNFYFLHTLCGHFTTNKNLTPYFKPFIYDNQFYFAFSTYIIDQNVSSFVKTDLTLLTLQFTSIFDNNSNIANLSICNMRDCSYINNVSKSYCPTYKSTDACEPCAFYTFKYYDAKWPKNPLLTAPCRFCTCGCMSEQQYIIPVEHLPTNF